MPRFKVSAIFEETIDAESAYEAQTIMQQLIDKQTISAEDSSTIQAIEIDAEAKPQGSKIYTKSDLS